MENKVIYIEEFNEDLFEEGLTIKLDGTNLKTQESFLNAIEEKLQFPYPCKGSLDSYLDWMRDLSWLNSKEIKLVIFNYENFLSENMEIKKIIIDCFKEDILPYWEEEVKTTMVDGEPRRFNVYLVSNFHITEAYNTL